MSEMLERQQFTPEGQELPAWLSYQVITTTIDGAAVTTGTILKLPLTYYGPSIPLGPDWIYGGETSPTTIIIPATAATSTASTAEPITSTLEPTLVIPSSIIEITTSATATTTMSTSSSPILAASSMLSSAPIALTTSSDVPPTSTVSITSAAPSAGPLPSQTITEAVSDPDMRTTLLVLLPSILGPLLLAIIILLLCFCLLRRRRGSYARAATSDPSAPINNTPRHVSSGGKLPLTPPRTKSLRRGTATEKAPLLALQHSTSRGPVSAGGPAILEAADEPEEGDIADFANPHRSSILSRLSLGLGIAPTMRRISNGAAEKAYRTPSWALAGLAALPRRISSSFRPTRISVVPVTSEKPREESQDASTLNQSSGNGDTTTEPQSAGYARTMGDDELFYRPPGRSPAAPWVSRLGTGSSRDSDSESSRSTRGTGPSGWQAIGGSVLDAGHGMEEIGRTVSVGIPETPGTGAGSIGSSFLGMNPGERERRSRWVEEGDRMEFPVPPGLVSSETSEPGSPLGARRNRDSVLSGVSGNTNYYSATSNPASLHHTTLPSAAETTIRLIQPTHLGSPDDPNDTTLRNQRPILSSRLSESQRGSENTRRSFIGEPLLGPHDTAMGEFGQLRNVSAGQINTLISVPIDSHARSSHYASVHISDSSRSMYSQNSTDRSAGSLAEHAQLSPVGEAAEDLAGSRGTFGAVSDWALRGRRSHATLVSAKSIRLVPIRQNHSDEGDVPPVPPKSPARPPALTRLSSGREMRGGTSKVRSGSDEVAAKRSSWFAWKKD